MHSARVLLEPKTNWALLAGCLFGVFCVVLFVVYTLSKSSVVAGGDGAVRYNARPCGVTGDQLRRPLRIYVMNHLQAERFLSAFCGSQEVAQWYDGMEVVWQHESAERYLALQGQFDVLATSPLLVATMPVGEASLDAIAAYPDYEVIWLGRIPPEGVTPQALGTMQIGLRASPLSVSGRLVPEERLRSLGLDPQRLGIRLYRRHSELRDALLAGDVDLVATFLDEIAAHPELSQFEREPLMQVPGVHWYIARSLVGTPIHCMAEKVLRKEAEAQTSGYFSELKVVRPCVT